MKRYNAFTLIELLGVLILLAVIALITYPIIDKVLSNAKNEAYERQKDSIIEASRLYVTTNGNYSTSQTQLSFQTLIDAGFLKEGEILDPRDSSKEMPGCVIYSWSEDKNQYMFEYSEDCTIGTPGECFAYQDITLVDSFDINYDACVTYMTSLDLGFTTEEIDLYCKGVSAYGDTMQDAINDGYLDINELTSNNVITNVVETTGIEITGYDNTCGGIDVLLPKSINGKDILSIGREAFGEVYIEPMYNDSNINSYIIGNFGFNYYINSIDMSNAVKLQKISDSAFSQNLLTNVSIPNSVTIIGEGAFAANQLTSVTIPNSVIEIGRNAFAYNQLTSVTIPNSVTEIGSDAFLYNQLTSVTIPDSITTIGDSSFKKNQLTNVSIPDSVTTIGYSAFSNNQLTSVTIPNSVTTIGYSAFERNQLTSVTIGNSVTEIGRNAFYKYKSTYFNSNSNLTTITNQTGKVFDWGKIVNGGYSATEYNFEIGTVVNEFGNVEITK